jgi:hypothetical protein
MIIPFGFMKGVDAPAGGRVYTPGNLILFPEDLSNGVWTKGYVSVSSTGNTDPFGGSTSIKYNNWSSTRTTIRQTVTVTTGVEYTLTFYAKKGTTTDMRWGVTRTTNVVIVASTSYLSQTTQDVWELVSVSFTSASANLYVFLAYDHGSTGTFEVWGANLDLTSNY